jgi:hypothetical protein
MGGKVVREKTCAPKQGIMEKTERKQWLGKRLPTPANAYKADLSRKAAYAGPPETTTNEARTSRSFSR